MAQTPKITKATLVAAIKATPQKAARFLFNRGFGSGSAGVSAGVSCPRAMAGAVAGGGVSAACARTNRLLAAAKSGESAGATIAHNASITTVRIRVKRDNKGACIGELLWAGLDGLSGRVLRCVL